MVLLSLKEIVGAEDYYIDDKTLQIWSFKQKKYENGKLLKPRVRKDGYIEYRFCVNGKQKTIYYHKIIVKMFIKKDYDSTKEEIDHVNHNRQDNSIENLKVVSRNKFNYVDNIGKSLIINKEAGIFYSLDLDKFYMFIEHTNKFKELHENIYGGYPCITYCYNNKDHMFRTTKFRKNIK